MALVARRDLKFLEALSELAYCNPFLPERVELERKALGRAFTAVPRGHHWLGEGKYEHSNFERLDDRVEPLAESLRSRLADGAAASEPELVLYEDLALYLLYRRYSLEFDRLIDPNAGEQPVAGTEFWKRYLHDFKHFMLLPARELPSEYSPEHVFACIFQIRRAFHYIFYYLVGTSKPGVLLRAAVWQSLFTHNMRRYTGALHRRMSDIPTLIYGETGTGKELVARALGFSQYVPFSRKRERFQSEYAESFHALNLSALAPTLIESELFGHVKGAFTGAIRDRKGLLEICEKTGAVFLDEIGEVDMAVQVKLLRALETRTFQRLGDNKPRTFAGKILTATNRDLAAEMRADRFREDLYYRLCADMITTPTLREQLADSPDDLHTLLLFIARQVFKDEAESLAKEVEAWIDRRLGRDYPWPGNFRELEQCVRNVMIHKEYRPAYSAAQDSGNELQRVLGVAAEQNGLSADNLVRQYCTVVYARTESYQETARILNLNWRTVKARIDHGLLKELRGPTE